MRKLFLLALCLTTLNAEEVQTVEKPIGTREMSPIERHAILEKRIKRDEDPTSVLEEGEVLEAKKGYGTTIDYTSHMGAYHHPIMIHPLGDVVELEDGSKWGVYYGDRNKSYNWLTTDALKITPNKAWFSSYAYRLTNLNTGDSLEVNLIGRPLTVIDPYTFVYQNRVIVAIDYYQKEICLNDGSIWSISGFDGAVLDKWLILDAMIIGHNDGFFSSSRPNILINCETNNYVEARCLN